jgi:hypothetical protein
MSFTSTIRRFLVAATVSTAAVAAVGAGSSSAASLNHVHAINVNNVYGQVSAGQALISVNNTWITVTGYLRDKPDGFYVTLQVNPLVTYRSTGLSRWGGWRNVGTTGVEAAPGTYVSKPIAAVAGSYFTDAEVRLCQTDRNGNIPAGARCSVAVPLDNWQSYYA